MGCSRTLNSIPMECTPSMGGIVEAYITQYVDGLFQYSTDTGASSSDVVIPTEVTGVTSGGTWNKIQFRKGVSNFTSTYNLDAATGLNFVSTDINFVFNKMQTASRIAISAMAYAGMALVVKDSNGKYWAFGLDEPVLLSAGTAETGTAKTDASQYSVTLQDNSLFLPIEVQKSVGEGIAQSAI